ncbi:MAG: serine hydrolase domain-containing protein [Terriglobales bacterium]
MCYNRASGTCALDGQLRGVPSLDKAVSTPPPLAAQFDAQETAFEPPFVILREALASHAFPGAAVSVVGHGKLVALRGMGRFTYDYGSPEVAAETIFDLASVSKVVGTTAMAMLLYQRGHLDLDVPVAGIIPQFAKGDARRQSVTVRMLLAHSSGLPAYVRLYRDAQTREQLLEAALAVPLEADPDTRAAYSDIGFIILGAALERIADEPLQSFCAREVFGPLGMHHTTYCPPAQLRSSIPPTQDDREFRGRIIQGEVQDENASVLGGVAGHAGIFSNAADLAAFAHCMLQGGRPILRPDTVDLFTRRHGASSRTLGWDTPSTPSQSGKYFSPRSFGHLGYTGTSLWIDPERRLAIVLLTNRTWPDTRSELIKQVRPQFHDAVVESLEEQGA